MTVEHHVGGSRVRAEQCEVGAQERNELGWDGDAADVGDGAGLERPPVCVFVVLDEPVVGSSPVAADGEPPRAGWWQLEVADDEAERLTGSEPAEPHHQHEADDAPVPRAHEGAQARQGADLRRGEDQVCVGGRRSGLV